MKKHYKKIIAAVGSLAVFVLMFLYLTGSLSGEKKIAPAKGEIKTVSADGLQTAQVKTIIIPAPEEVVGTVTARETTKVSSRIMAVITNVNAAAGDQVKEGQPLFVLDSRDGQARLSQAREAATSAEAALQRASLDAGRIERLYNKEAATKQEYDGAQATLKMAQAGLDAAKATVREAEVNLSFTTVKAPAGGRVIDRFADPGDMAVPGQPLMTIYVPSSLRLEVSVPDQLRSRVNLGDKLTASFDTDNSRFEGQVAEIVPASDASSRSFTMRVTIPPTVTAYPGMYGRIWIPVGSTQIVVIPPEAIQYVGQLEMANVVKDGSAQTRLIKTGQTYPEGVEILSGLSSGEQVALNDIVKDSHGE
jgi:membrane fusion protein (multidrug efflux system)